MVAICVCCCRRRLPLCLNVAARVIAESGEDWETEVLPALRAGVSDFIDDGGGDNGGLSTQQSLIETSLAALQGRSAPRIKRLLLHAGVFAEVYCVWICMNENLHLLARFDANHIHTSTSRRTNACLVSCSIFCTRQP